MKRRALFFIIGLMALSAFGLIGLQAFWLRNTWQAKEEQFDRSVNEALNRVVSQLETREVASVVKQHFAVSAPQGINKPATVSTPEKPKPSKTGKLKTLAKSTEKAAPKTTQEKSVLIKQFNYTLAESPDLPLKFLAADSLVFRNFRNPEMTTKILDSLLKPTRMLRLDSVLRLVKTDKNRHIIIRQNFNLDSSVRVIYRPSLVLADTLQFFRKPQPQPKPVEVEKKILATRQRQKQIIERKQEQVGEVMQKMVVELVKKDVPLKKRVNAKVIDSLLAVSLADKGITLPYSYKIAGKNTPAFASNKTTNQFQQSLPFYKVSLFPNDLVQKSDYLMLQFPDKQQYVLASMGTMFGFSALFNLIIFATFGATLSVIFKQKKISEIKSDFINNMTHEFKTPIATISLATDAINSPKVLQDQQRIHYYTSIIQQENKRMLSQVENVLQMALLDRQELQLNLEKVSLQSILEIAIEKLKLQIENRNGNIIFETEEAPILLSADKLHLENAFLNLLDNANKYSPETPQIKVSVQKHKGQAVVTISDQGIGMTAEAQRRIFDKFYRVPTGNLHDVKGFGLGLSYVKTIVQLHRGQISVKSAIGKGSTFQVQLPLA